MVMMVKWRSARRSSNDTVSWSAIVAVMVVFAVSAHHVTPFHQDNVQSHLEKRSPKRSQVWILNRNRNSNNSFFFNLHSSTSANTHVTSATFQSTPLMNSSPNPKFRDFYQWPFFNIFKIPKSERHESNIVSDHFSYTNKGRNVVKTPSFTTKVPDETTKSNLFRSVISLEISSVINSTASDTNNSISENFKLIQTFKTPDYSKEIDSPDLLSVSSKPFVTIHPSVSPALSTKMNISFSLEQAEIRDFNEIQTSATSPILDEKETSIKNSSVPLNKSSTSLPLSSSFVSNYFNDETIGYKQTPDNSHTNVTNKNTQEYSLVSPFSKQSYNNESFYSNSLTETHNNTVSPFKMENSSRRNVDVTNSKEYVYGNENESVSNTIDLETNFQTNIKLDSGKPSLLNEQNITNETILDLITSVPFESMTENKQDMSESVSQKTDKKKINKYSTVTEYSFYYTGKPDYQKSTNSIVFTSPTDQTSTISSVKYKIDTNGPTLKISTKQKTANKKNTGKLNNSKTKLTKVPEVKKKHQEGKRNRFSTNLIQTQEFLASTYNFNTMTPVDNNTMTQSEQASDSESFQHNTDRRTREIHDDFNPTNAEEKTENVSLSTILEDDNSTKIFSNSITLPTSKTATKQYSSPNKNKHEGSRTDVDGSTANSIYLNNITQSSITSTEYNTENATQSVTFTSSVSSSTSTVKRSSCTPVENLETNATVYFTWTSTFLSLEVTLNITIENYTCQDSCSHNVTVRWTDANNNSSNITHYLQGNNFNCSITFADYYTCYNVCVEVDHITMTCNKFYSEAGNSTEPNINSDTMVCLQKVNISFDEPNDTNGPITFYEYKYKNSEAEYWNRNTSSTNDTFVLIQNLDHDQNYTFCLRAVNNETAEKTIFGREACKNYTTKLEDIHFNATNANHNSIIMNWTKPRVFNFCSLVFRAEAIPRNNCLHDTLKNTTNDDSIVLIGAHPNTLYELKLYGGTSAVEGNAFTNMYVTNIAAPEKPHNVTIISCTVSSCLVNWTICSLNGPTKFDVFIFQNDTTENISCGNTTLVNSSKIQTLQINCTGLVTYTYYKAIVSAEIEGFNLTSALSEADRTKPSEPERVNITEVNCNVSKTIGSISWMLPKKVTGELEKFEISFNGIRNGKTSHNKTLSLNQSDINCETICTYNLTLNPEFNYIIKVRAKNKYVESFGENDENHCYKKAEAPEKPSDSNLKAFQESISTYDETASFILKKDFFSDNMGDIINYNFYVYEDYTNIENSSGFPERIEKYWFHVHEEIPIPPYQVNDNNWNPFIKNCTDVCCNLNKDSVNYILGCDTSCDKLSNATPCNGPLRKNTKYKLVVRAYTRGGYVDIDPCGFQTRSDKVDIAIVLTVCFTFTLLILLAAMFLQYRRKDIKSLFRFCPPQHRDDPIGSHFPVPISNKSNTRPIPIEEFSKHYQAMIADSGLKFSREFEELKSISPLHPTTAAQLQENRSKNRWINILPFDHSRVKLLPVADEASTDYINACYIPGNSSQREFIATQGPLPQTTDDFWRMVWEQSVQMIVMLTQCVERGKVKCEQYWPDDDEVTYYGDIAVQLRSESILNGYTIRIFDLHLSQANSSSSTTEVDLPDSLSLLPNIDQGTKTLEVKQMHFTRWPDFGCPENTKDLITFVQAVREFAPHNLSSPIIAHCSAGVGRTGTFIAVDRLMQHIQHHSSVDVYGIVLEMRNFRAFMVQTEDQYIYIHSCIKDILDSRHSLIHELNNDIYENFPAVTNQDSQL